MPTHAEQLLELAGQLDDARSAKEKLLILGDMAHIIREAQQIYRLVEVVKDQLIEDGHLSATKALAAPHIEAIDAYPHLTALVNERK